MYPSPTHLPPRLSTPWSHYTILCNKHEQQQPQQKNIHSFDLPPPSLFRHTTLLMPSPSIWKWCQGNSRHYGNEDTSHKVWSASQTKEEGREVGGNEERPSNPPPWFREDLLGGRESDLMTSSPLRSAPTSQRSQIKCDRTDTEACESQATGWPCRHGFILWHNRASRSTQRRPHVIWWICDRILAYFVGFFSFVSFFVG